MKIRKTPQESTKVLRPEIHEPDGKKEEESAAAKGRESWMHAQRLTRANCSRFVSTSAIAIRTCTWSPIR